MSVTARTGVRLNQVHAFVCLGYGCLLRTLLGVYLRRSVTHAVGASLPFRASYWRRASSFPSSTPRACRPVVPVKVAKNLRLQRPYSTGLVSGKPQHPYSSLLWACSCWTLCWVSSGSEPVCRLAGTRAHSSCVVHVVDGLAKLCESSHSSQTSRH